MTGFKRAAAAAAVGAIATLGVGVPAAAFADDYTSPPPNVTPSDPRVLPATIEDPAPGGESLPFTGADVAQMTLVGTGAVVVGAVARRRARRSQTQTA